MAKHPELTGELLHIPGYVQDADPGVVGPGMLWVDTSGGAGLYQVKIRNDADDGWEAISVGGLTDHTLLSNVGVYTHPQIDIHINDNANPHAVTAAQAGAAEAVHDHTSMIHINVADEFAAAAEKFTLATNDKFLIEDSAAAGAKKFVRKSNLPGGAGATLFTALTDTPASYAGQTLKSVRVNAGETALEFYTPSGGSFLPLAGGVMTGDIDFSDLGEGIRFWDEDSAYFKGLYFDLSGDPEIRIGDNAAPFGGPPIVHANTPVFRIGYDGVGGFAALEMWNQDAGGYEPIITSISDNPGDPLEFGTGDHATNINGSETRPTYNGGDLALLSDVPVGGTYDPEAIPRMQIGSGQAHVSVINGLAVDVSPIPSTGGVGARICARDFIRFIRGGATVLNYKLELMNWNDSGGGTPSMAYSSDPTSPLDLDSDLGDNVGQVFEIRVWYQDNTTGDETYVLTYLLLQDNQGIVPPPGP